MKRVVWGLCLAVAACRGPEAGPDEKPPAKAKPATSKRAVKKSPAKKPPAKAKAAPLGLPDGFAVKGPPKIEKPYLGPSQTWRQVVSRLTVLRADAQRAGTDLLVSFVPGAVHVTDRAGARATWEFPPGLRFAQAGGHVIIGRDLNLTAYSADGAQIPAADEVTVAVARVAEEGGPAELFRLVIKGGRTFRSISNPG